jgi:hypothetical protein
MSVKSSNTTKQVVTVFETQFERSMSSKELKEAIAVIEEHFKSSESDKTERRKGSVHHERVVLGLNALNRRIEELEMVIMVHTLHISLSLSLSCTHTHTHIHTYNLQQCTDLRTSSQKNLIKHIPFLCASHGVPLYGIDRASFLLRKIFRVRKIAAFGIKKASSSEETSATSSSSTKELKRILPLAIYPKKEWFHRKK